MKTKTYLLLYGFVLSMAIFAAAHRLQATLGESVDSIKSDIEAFSAAPTGVMARDGYTIQEIDYDSTTVREYVSTAGVVFGVAWNGLVHPDLTQLLGSYADQYETALQQTPREPGRRRLGVKTNEVVVEKWGHMRNLQGRAYVPALIPPGVSVDEIK